MKTLPFSALALSLAMAATANAQLRGTTLTAAAAGAITSLDPVISTQWSGVGGTVYAPFQALSADQQAAELIGAIPAAPGSATAPETPIRLPNYAANTEPLPYGFGNTDVLTTVTRSEACPTSLALPVGSFNKVWSKSNTYGSSAFRSGYSAKMTFNATGAAGSANDRISAEVATKVNATVLGATGGIEGYALAKIQNTTPSDTMYLKVLGTTVWSHSGAASFSTNPSWSRTFAQTSQMIWLGPVPLSFTAKAIGTVGVQASLSNVGGKLTVAERPYTNPKAVVTASTGSAYYSVTATSNLSLINASLPSVAALTLKPALDGKSTFSYDLDLDATVTPLSGSVTLSSKIWYVFGSKKWTTTLANWSGVASTYTIVDVHGCAGKFTL